jgi:hypothetical protein
MFTGYNRSFRVHAAHHFLKAPEIPSPTLGIESGEVLNPITGKQPMPKTMRLPSIQKIKTDDDLARLGLGKPFSLDDFNFGGYYTGSVL